MSLLSAAWVDRAACKNTPIEWWYPDMRTGRHSETEPDGPVPAITKPYCNTCPVHTECLEHAIRFERFGVWAGTSMRQRERIRTARRRRRAPHITLVGDNGRHTNTNLDQRRTPLTNDTHSHADAGER